MKKSSGVLFAMLACQIFYGQALYKSPMDLIVAKEFKIKGNTDGPVDTKIMLDENDYVFVEAVGQIKVGNYLGNADPTGLLSGKLMFARYFKYPSLPHGSLVILTNDGTTCCKKIFSEMGLMYSNPFTPEYDSKVITEGTLRDYIPGYYFISQGKSPLYLDINDTVLEDNEGFFTVKVYVIKFKNHLNRNFFNYCPAKEPESGEDAKLLLWNKENAVKSSVYHGVLNSSYRGGSVKNSGCQCVYGDFRKTLVQNEENQGSFDLGYWLFKDKPWEETTKNYYHLVLDVIPHDLYVDKFCDEITIYKVFKNTSY